MTDHAFYDFGDDKFLNAHRAMLLHLAGRYASPGTDQWMDFVAAGISGLYEAKSTYQKSRGAYATWAYWHVRKSIQNETVGHRLCGLAISDVTAKQLGLSMSLGLEPDLEAQESSCETPYDMLVDKEEAEERGRKSALLWRRLERRFSVADREVVLDFFLSGITVSQCEKKHGTGKTWRILARARMFAAGNE